MRRCLPWLQHGVPPWSLPPTAALLPFLPWSGDPLPSSHSVPHLRRCLPITFPAPPPERNGGGARLNVPTHTASNSGPLLSSGRGAATSAARSRRRTLGRPYLEGMQTEACVGVVVRRQEQRLPGCNSLHRISKLTNKVHENNLDGTSELCDPTTSQGYWDFKSCNCSGTSCRLQIMNKNRAAICFVLFKSSDPDIALCIMYFQKITVSLVIFCHGEDIVAWLPPFRLCSFAITAYFVKHLKKDIAEFRSFYMEVRTWKNRQNVLFLCVYRIVHYYHVTPSLHNQYRFT